MKAQRLKPEVREIIAETLGVSAEVLKQYSYDVELSCVSEKDLRKRLEHQARLLWEVSRWLDLKETDQAETSEKKAG